MVGKEKEQSSGKRHQLSDSARVGQTIARISGIKVQLFGNVCDVLEWIQKVPV
jgi:hypothetical protein